MVPTRGCALFNGDGKFDYTRWENIVPDPIALPDNNNSDEDNIEEENLSVVIDGRTFTKQAAEVHSDFDFYCEYENIKTAANLSVHLPFVIILIIVLFVLPPYPMPP